MSAAHEQKQRVADAAVDLIEDGMTLGLGTGSTAALALASLGKRVAAGLRVRGVPTSFASERLAREHGIPLTTLDETPTLDLAFDGADAFDETTLALIKGRGAAMTREKIVASAALRFVVLVDAGKRSNWLGSDVAVPVEIVPMAARPVSDRLRALGADPNCAWASAKTVRSSRIRACGSSTHVLPSRSTLLLSTAPCSKRPAFWITACSWA